MQSDFVVQPGALPRFLFGALAVTNHPPPHTAPLTIRWSDPLGQDVLQKMENNVAQSTLGTMAPWSPLWLPPPLLRSTL